MRRGLRDTGDVAVHRTATIKHGAVSKGLSIVGSDCLVAAGSLLRGGCWLDCGCVVGPGVELKTSIVFAESRLAHFDFVGDSILGRDVNLEAGAVVANHRNELADFRPRIRYDGRVITSDVTKLGALVRYGSRIGANAVIAPGAVSASRTVVSRLCSIDQ